jgi:hypothetical protein
MTALQVQLELQISTSPQRKLEKMNQCECFLQGVLQDSLRDSVVQKLKGLCQSVEKPFTFREINFKSVPVPGMEFMSLKF